MLSEQEMYHAIEHYFWSALSSETITIDNAVNIYIGSTNNSYFNFIYVSENASEGSIKIAIQKMRLRRNLFILVAHENVLEALMKHQYFGQLSYNSVTTAMIINLTDYQNTIQDEDIFLTSQNLSNWLKPLTDAFLMDDKSVAEQYVQAHRSALNKNKDIYHFALVKDELPITALTLTISNNIARLDDIGTLLSQQKKGYGTRMIHHALSVAKAHGAQYCTLEASGQGMSTYKRLGFQSLFQSHTFLAIQ